MCWHVMHQHYSMQITYLESLFILCCIPKLYELSKRCTFSGPPRYYYSLLRHRGSTYTIQSYTVDRAATTAEKFGGPRFGTQHGGACWMLGAGRGRSLPLWWSGPGGPDAQMLNPAFWWLLCLLVGSLGREVGGSVHGPPT